MTRHAFIASLLAAAALTTIEVIEARPIAVVAAPVSSDAIVVRGQFVEPLYGLAERGTTTIYAEAHLDAAAVTRADGTPVDEAIELAPTTSYELIAPAQTGCSAKPSIRIHDGELVVVLHAQTDCPAMASQANGGVFHAKTTARTASGQRVEVEIELR